MDSFPRGVPAVQFHNRSPSLTDDIEICQSYISALSSRTSTYVLVQWSPLKSYDNFIPAAYLRVQIRNSMSSCKKALKKCQPPWLADEEHFSIVIRTQKCFERRFALSALLFVFHYIISWLIAFHFIVLLITFSK